MLWKALISGICINWAYSLCTKPKILKKISKQIWLFIIFQFQNVFLIRISFVIQVTTLILMMMSALDQKWMQMSLENSAWAQKVIDFRYEATQSLFLLLSK